ncbi:hypothetical protein HII36_24655 [Nonomuraea sp. NN258]|uniref:hypothetical protein n=1 Tax=Nonomuraea antri TaxID=2730852 RepID=UPI0015687356|nr:hypothetical protein [Nonomuraea antri]NRQ34993.1 hypothetical protein [Nonomuraea antri]
MSPRSLVLPVAALCAGGLAVLAYFQESDLLLLNDHLNHPFAFGALACALAIWAALRLRPRWLGVLISVVAGLGLCAVVLAGMFFAMFGSRDEAGFVDGPGSYRIRLQESLAGLGPDLVTWLSLRRDAGLFTKEWDLGCFNDDVPGDGYDSVTWTGPHTLEIRTTDGQTFPITLDPVSGRPRNTATVNC